MPMCNVLYFVGIIVAIVSVLISINVRARFDKWAEIPNSRRRSGRETAERMLKLAGINDVQVVQTKGVLTDHYDPKKKTVNLSEAVFEKQSIAAVAVAAHECGHAIQHHEVYAPLTLRHKLVPMANFGSQASIYVFMLGLLLVSLTKSSAVLWVVDIAILFFGLGVIFHLVTLPVEFNASRRALTIIREDNMLSKDEMGGARKVLTAAALTYVTAAAASAIQLLRMIAIRNND